MSHIEKIHFLINPRSGGDQGGRLLHELKSIDCSSGMRISAEALQPDQLVEQLAAIDKSTRLVIGGGDGTISKILGMLSDSGSIVGIIPLGTGNDLARELGLVGSLPLDNPVELCKFFLGAEVVSLTVFVLNFGEQMEHEVRFTNYISFGLDAQVVADFEQLRSNRWWTLLRGRWPNRAAYAVLAARRIFSKIKGSPTIANDHGESFSFKFPCSLIFPNITSVMGLGRSNFHSSCFDNEIEALAIKNPLSYLSMLTSYSLPIFRPQFLGASSTWEISHLPLETRLQVDGEPHQEFSSSRCKIARHGTVQVLCYGRQK